MPEIRHFAPVAAGLFVAANVLPVAASDAAHHYQQNNSETEFNSGQSAPERFTPNSSFSIGAARVTFGGLMKTGKELRDRNTENLQFQAEFEVAKAQAEGEIAGFLEAVRVQEEVNEYLESVESERIRQEQESKQQRAAKMMLPISGTLIDWLVEAGVDDIPNAAWVFTKESSGNPRAVNSGGCIGLGQACPSGIKSRLLARCPDWENQPVCQIQVFDEYAKNRYGSWQGVVDFWVKNNWY